MDDTVTVRDVMRRAYVGVSEGDSIAGVASLMHEERSDSAVVLRGGEPVGLLTAQDVVGVVADGEDPAELAAVDVMRDPVVTIDADHSLAEAVGAITDRDVRQVVALEEGEVAGVLSEHDIVRTPSIFPEPGAESQPVTTGTGRRPEVATTERGEAIREGRPVENDAYATQGVCEVCGSLTAELRSVNGQLVCADCRPA